MTFKIKNIFHWKIKYLYKHFLIRCHKAFEKFNGFVTPYYGVHRQPMIGLLKWSLLLIRIFLKDEKGDLSDFIIWDFSVMNLVYFYLTVMTRSFDWIKPNRISRYLTKINYAKIVLVLLITLKRSDSTPLSLLLEIRFEGEINPSGRSFNFG